MNKTNAIAAGLGAAAIALGGYWFYRHSVEAEPAQKEAVPAPGARPQELRFPPGASQLSFVKTEPVTAHPEPLLDPLNARITYDENYTQRVATPIAGRVVRILAQPGDRVAAGQALVEVDAPEFAQAESDVNKSAADLGQKQAAYRRAKELVDAEVAARKELEIADADLKQAQAEHNRALARLSNLTQGQSRAGTRFTLRSRIGGVVAERKVNPGAEVRPDLPDPLFIVTDPTHLWVIVDLPERLLGSVHKGQKATIEVDAYPRQSFPATVANIGEVVDPATRRIPVRCIAPNPKGLLKPEMYARVIPLADGEHRLTRVPNSALITEGLYTYVFVETEPGVFRKRRVTPGLQGRNESYIKDGLKEGEKVVTGGALLLNAELAGT
ncbi:MAG TPA: efflux RND transporter periplasmic adaptor subunit [Burkholderiales bacterium]|nr:efflux RND transporter periplasmic adaptor subunit [Burkholderiales bacterium]